MRAALALLLLAAPAAAQEYEPGGSDLFRGVLRRYGYVPTPGSGVAPRSVVVFGDPGQRLPWLASQCETVLNDGGSVLVAAGGCDRLRQMLPGRPPVLLTGLPVGGPVATRQVAAARPEAVAVARPVAQAGLPELPAVVAVGLPARELRVGDLRPARGTGVFAEYASRRPFGLALTGPGRVVVLAGESALSNRLLAATFVGPGGEADTGNLELAVALARWLRPGDGLAPCLFVEYGEVVREFGDVFDQAPAAPQLPTPAPPPLSALLAPEAQAKLTDAVNETADRVQANDRLNPRLAGGDRFRRSMVWLAAALALLLAVTLVRRARAAGRPAAPPPEPVAPPRAGGVFAQRREELLRGGDHTAAVREYLAELFRARGLPLDEYRHPRRLPRVEADPVTRRQLATLWEAAYGPAPVTYTRWKELEPMVEAVRAAGQAGRWRFAGGRA